MRSDRRPGFLGYPEWGWGRTEVLPHPDNDRVGAWIGSTLGMVAADALAIVVGAIAASTFPSGSSSSSRPRCSWPSAIGMLVGGPFPAAPIPVVVGSAVVVVVLFAVVLRPMPERLRPAAMRTEPVSLTS